LPFEEAVMKRIMQVFHRLSCFALRQ